MKQVDIIRPGSINAIIGPVGTLKRMLKNQEYFNARGYEVTVFTNESITLGPIKEPPVAVRQKLPFVQRLRRRIGSFLKMQARTNTWLSKFFIRKEEKMVESLVDYYLSLNRHPDIIQFHSNMECQLYLQKMGNVHAKTVMFLHTDGIPLKMLLQYYPKLEGTSYINKLQDEFSWTIANTDKIVFIAKIGQKNFLQYFPNRTYEDTLVIINGIDDLTVQQRKEVETIREECEKTDFKYRLCCSGTINSRKGHRIIIDAVRSLAENLRNQIHVDFMGDGPELPELKKLVDEYGMNDQVTFYGMVPNAEIYKYLAKNNIYILMSKNEGLPISIIEAMRASLPIISTKVSGIPELVNEGENGCLLNPDVNELISVLVKLPEYDWGQMGKNSRARFKKDFTFERMKKEFCDMYDSL